MSRRNWQDGVEVVLEDLNAISKALERNFYDRIIYEIIQRQEDAFFDDGFEVSYASATTVVVKKGLGFQTDSSQVSPEPDKRLLFRGSDVNKTISTPDGSQDRIDIVVCKNIIVDELSDTRKFKNASTGVITDETVVTQKDWEAEITMVAGTPAGVPVAPATPSGYIKLAELEVTAVTGMSGAGAVTDSRNKMPLGSLATINTVGFARLTAGASTSLATLFADIDALLKNGYFEYYDVDELGAHPSAPAASKRRVYFYDSVMYEQDSSGVKTPLGSGGGGGGGLILTVPDGIGPLEDEENSVDIMKFEAGLSSELDVFMKVPESFIPGRQIFLYAGIYSPSAANTILLSANAALVRVNQDSVASPIANRDSTNSALTNTVANQYRKVTMDLSDGTGKIGGYAIQPGDILKIKLTRGTDTDTAEMRFMPTTIEPKFG